MKEAGVFGENRCLIPSHLQLSYMPLPAAAGHSTNSELGVSNKQS